jgi:hypothetical protein
VQPIRKSLWLLLLAGSLITPLAASPPVLGVAQSRAAFYMNNALVPGTGTILDGTAIRTDIAPSELSLRTGEHLRLSANSALVVHADRVVLQSGLAELSRGTAYRIDAQNLQITPLDQASRVSVSLGSGNVVLVSTAGGSADIRNGRGVLVARMYPGEQKELRPANPDSIQLTGTVRKQGNSFVLEDETTHLTVELRGDNLKGFTGKVVQIKGVVKPEAHPVPGASQVVLVTTATVADVSGGTGAKPAAAANAGHSTRATIAIVGGVAAASSAGGLAAVGTFSGSAPSVSR